MSIPPSASPVAASAVPTTVRAAPMSLARAPARSLSRSCSAFRSAAAAAAFSGEVSTGGRVGAVTLPSSPTVKPSASAPAIVLNSRVRAWPMSVAPVLRAAAGEVEGIGEPGAGPRLFGRPLAGRHRPVAPGLGQRLLQSPGQGPGLLVDLGRRLADGGGGSVELSRTPRPHLGDGQAGHPGSLRNRGAPAERFRGVVFMGRPARIPRQRRGRCRRSRGRWCGLLRRAPAIPRSRPGPRRRAGWTPTGRTGSSGSRPARRRRSEKGPATSRPASAPRRRLRPGRPRRSRPPGSTMSMRRVLPHVRRGSTPPKCGARSAAAAPDDHGLAGRGLRSTGAGWTRPSVRRR